mmetsp:Transcript_46805/g.108747  ORF Transcript_46805/g.108747 Transcript_46805/m.108747 type:complete len:215 (-) Transcript_46805:191-835(-)
MSRPYGPCEDARVCSQSIVRGQARRRAVGVHVPDWHVAGPIAERVWAPRSVEGGGASNSRWRHGHGLRRRGRRHGRRGASDQRRQARVVWRLRRCADGGQRAWEADSGTALLSERANGRQRRRPSVRGAGEGGHRGLVFRGVGGGRPPRPFGVGPGPFARDAVDARLHARRGRETRLHAARLALEQVRGWRRSTARQARLTLGAVGLGAVRRRG